MRYIDYERDQALIKDVLKRTIKYYNDRAYQEDATKGLKQLRLKMELASILFEDEFNSVIKHEEVLDEGITNN